MKPEWETGSLTPSELISVATDAIADLAASQAKALDGTLKEVTRRREFLGRLENILFCATGNPYSVRVKVTEQI